MASERQIEANRRNGQKGGPKTEEGKLRSRENAVRHGHCATIIQLIPGEDPAEWEAIRESIVEHSNAATGAERVVLEQMALHHWRTIRIHRSENRMLTVQQDIHIKEGQQTAPHKDPKAFEADRAGALAVSLMITPDNQWTNYLRYEAAISRDFNRSVNQLVSLQNMRLRHERATGIPLVEPTPVPEPEHAEPLVLAAGATDTVLIPRDSDSQTCFGGQASENGILDRVSPGRFVSPPSAPTQSGPVSQDLIVAEAPPSDLPSSVFRLPSPESGSVPQNSAATALPNPASAAPADLPTSENGIPDRVSPGRSVSPLSEPLSAPANYEPSAGFDSQNSAANTPANVETRLPEREEAHTSAA